MVFFWEVGWAGSVKKSSETLTCKTAVDRGASQQEMEKVCCAQGSVGKAAEAGRRILSLMNHQPQVP